MKIVDIIVGMLCGIGLCIVLVWMVNKPAIAQVEAPLPPEPTAQLYDSTQFQIGYATIALQMVRFRDGTVCVTAKSYNSSSALQLECDFSHSATVNRQ